MAIYGNMVGGGSAPLKTLILTDENGNELFGVVTDSEQILTANASTDIREGVVAVTDKGIETGSAVIPNYNTHEGSKLILNGKSLVLYMPRYYDYTKLQAIVCSYNTNLTNSVSSEQVVINDNVYAVRSTDIVSSVTIDANSESINFGITNTSGSPCLIRYFMCKEMY